MSPLPRSSTTPSDPVRSADPRLPDAAPLRRTWAAPTVTPLPPLTALTLQTGGSIGGGWNGGSTVL